MPKKGKKMSGALKSFLKTHGRFPKKGEMGRSGARTSHRTGGSMPKKGKKRKGGGGRRRSHRGGARFHFSVVNMGRKIAKVSAPIDAIASAADNIAAGDFAGGLKDGLATLSGDLTGFDVVNHQIVPQNLIWGYGPGVSVELINAGLHFLKAIARGFGGRSSAAM